MAAPSPYAYLQRSPGHCGFCDGALPPRTGKAGRPRTICCGTDECELAFRKATQGAYYERKRVRLGLKQDEFPDEGRPDEHLETCPPASRCIRCWPEAM